jgi:hypothetical protein
MQIEINNDLQILDQWAKTWLVYFNRGTPALTRPESDSSLLTNTNCLLRMI